MNFFFKTNSVDNPPTIRKNGFVFKPYRSVDSDPARFFTKNKDDESESCTSQFLLDEKDLWENIQDIHDLANSNKGNSMLSDETTKNDIKTTSDKECESNSEFQDKSLFDEKTPEKKSEKTSELQEKPLSIEVISLEENVGNNELEDKSMFEEKTADSDSEKTIEDSFEFEPDDYCFQIPSNDKPCFDLDIETEEDNNSEKNDIIEENCKSPTFDVSFKSSCKTFSSQSSKKNLSAEEIAKVENKSKPYDFSQENLNPLGLAEEADAWLEKILQNEAFFSVSNDTPEEILQKNLNFLNKSYVEILEKVMTAFENLPTKMLQMFPEFDPEVFMALRTTRRRIKAVSIKTENLLKRKNTAPVTSVVNNTVVIDSTNPTEPESSFQRDFSRISFSSCNEINNSYEEGSVNRSSEGVFTFKHPSKSLIRTVAETNQSKLNFPVVESPKESTNFQLKANSYVPQVPTCSTPLITTTKIDEKLSKPSTSLNLSVVDYTDVLFKTPEKTSERNTGKFRASMKNDGACGEFNGLNFPHSKDLLEKFNQKFGLRSFRPNQLQAMNAALLGHDCFILMPTGGGKSLCYQLPALVSKGVTVVISPLRSLILDQVTKLLTLDIAAAHLSGDIKESEANSVYRRLNQPEPLLKLLYVTPEKVGVSTNLKNCLQGLYKRGMLARFVIDEAHCVSQWGHDFRPDYKKLRELRENFPKVNIMALTATATPRVRTDILHQLKVINPKWFLSSFNRSNLTYSVKEKKGKSTIKDIATLIQKDFKKDTGVIYCFSRKECEDVAKDLKIYGITAIPYHAGLNDNERTLAQNLWMNDKVKVVCATIAFGMGIDKLDVRFVIHYSLPKSIEGYYQESGRAGRDGEKATCILYYSYRDKIRMLKLLNMDQTITNEAAKKVHLDNLFRVVAFAENKTECRRALQLEYFGEHFDRKLCLENRSTACDNCLQQGIYETIDVTTESKAIVSAVRQICGSDGQRYSNFTMLHFVDVFKGATNKKVLSERHDKLPMYGMGKSWLKVDIERLFRKLIMEEFIKERLMVKDDGITFAYIKFGLRGEELLKGNVKIMFEVQKRKGSTVVQSGNVNNENRIDPVVLEIQEKCYSDLMNCIHEIASSVNCNPNAIMNVQALRAMSSSLPETAEEMLSINHVTTANFEKYGNILLEVTKKYAAEKKALKISELVEEEEDLFIEEHWPNKNINESPYFETEITFEGRNSKGKKRKKSNNFRKWQNTKKWKGSGSSSKSKGGGSKTNSKSAGNSSSGVSTVPGAKFSTLMELPTSKSRGFARPKVILKNL